MEYELVNIREHPEWREAAAQWFHEKWRIPAAAYLESIERCIETEGAVPRWYIAAERGRIIGGLGVIENDFHERKDLTPNVCALYVEEECRCQGIAGALLRRVCADMENAGAAALYLVTDHTAFYERYGWEFLCMVQGEGEPEPTRMYIHRTKDSRTDVANTLAL